MLNDLHYMTHRRYKTEEEERIGMITDHKTERRCRYRLARHGLRVHKVKGCYGPMYFACYGDDDPPEWQRHYMSLTELSEFAEVLAEKDASYKADKWNRVRKK